MLSGPGNDPPGRAATAFTGISQASQRYPPLAGCALLLAYPAVVSLLALAVADRRDVT